MNNATKTTQAALKNLISSKLSSLKICFRKSLENKYADQWAKEEAKINALAQELKTGINQGDTKRIQEAIDSWKSYLIIDSNWKSERISETKKKSFLNTSDGRFYGGALIDFMILLEKLDGNNTSTVAPNPAVTSLNSAKAANVNLSNNKTTSDNMLTIEHPLTGDKLQVANQDFSCTMTWTDAKRACSELGSAWRLPTLVELEAMYKQLHSKGQGNFKDSWYWSSTEANAPVAFYFDFDDGNATNGSKAGTYSVRAVRAF